MRATCAVRLRRGRRHVDALAREHLRDVAQQPGAVERLDHRRPTGNVAPAASPHSARHQRSRIEPLHVRAIGAMHAHAAAARDEADDGVRRRGLAALRGQGEQLVDADDQHAARSARRATCARAAAALSGARLGARRAATHPAAASARSRRAPISDRKSLSLLEAHVRGELVEVERGHAVALQLLLEQRAALRDVGLEVLAVEPLPHLGARAVALEEAERRIQPVAARPALLRRDDLDLLAVLRAAC